MRFVTAVLRSPLSILAVCAFGFGSSTQAGTATTAELVARVIEAKAEFEPITDQQVTSALDQVQRSLRRIHEWVDRDPRLGPRWSEYLKSDEQMRRIELGTDQDTEFWEAILRRVTIDSAGLHDDLFCEYRTAMRDLIGALEARLVPDLQVLYEARLDRLAAALPKLSENPTRAQADEISNLLSELYRRHQARHLVQAIRQANSYPNVVVSIPVDMVSAQVVGKTEATTPVEDVIDGARVRGTARMTAQRAAVFPESDDDLQMKIDVAGISNSRTQSNRQGVTTHNTGRLTFVSRASLEFNEAGFDISPFATTATLQTQLLDVSTPFRGIRRRIAQRRARDRQPVARREAERKAIRQLNDGFSRELRTSLDPWMAKYDEMMRRPLLCRDLFPGTSHFAVRNKRIQLEYSFDHGCRLTALDSPACNETDDALSVCIHESAFNNSISSSLPRRRTSLTQVFQENFGQGGLPENINDEARLFLTLADQRPLSLTLDDQMVTLVLNAQEFESAGQRYAAMELQFRYELDKEGTEWVLKAHEPVVLMPRRADGSRPRLGIRDYSLRRILLNTIARDQPSKLFVSEMLATLLAASSVELEHVQLQNGWIQLRVRDID